MTSRVASASYELAEAITTTQQARAILPDQPALQEVEGRLTALHSRLAGLAGPETPSEEARRERVATGPSLLSEAETRTPRQATLEAITVVQTHVGAAHSWLFQSGPDESTPDLAGAVELRQAFQEIDRNLLAAQNELSEGRA